MRVPLVKIHSLTMVERGLNFVFPENDDYFLQEAEDLNIKLRKY
jgi:hypothetical protein